MKDVMEPLPLNGKVIITIEDGLVVCWEEVKHGWWIDIEQAPHKCVYATCSVCGERQTLEKMKYCPSCGSRMESKCVKCEGGYCEDECGVRVEK